MYIDDSLTSQKFGDMFVDRRDCGFKRLNTFVYAKNLMESVFSSRQELSSVKRKLFSFSNRSFRSFWGRSRFIN